MRFFRVCQFRILALEGYHNLSWWWAKNELLFIHHFLIIIIYSFVTCFLNVLEQAKAIRFL